MPITQQRMMGLIDAALDYKRAYESLRQFIIKENKIVEEGTSTDANFRANVAQVVEYEFNFLENLKDSAMAIAIEEYHFAKFARTNDRSRMKAAKRREENIGQSRRTHITLPYEKPRLAHPIVQRQLQMQRQPPASMSSLSPSDIAEIQAISQEATRWEEDREKVKAIFGEDFFDTDRREKEEAKITDFDPDEDPFAPSAAPPLASPPQDAQEDNNDKDSNEDPEEDPFTSLEQ
jgi:hypothetical protein